MRRLFLSLTLIVLLGGAIAHPAGAQPLRGQNPKQFRKGKAGPLPIGAIRRFLQMSPEQREAALARLPEPRRTQAEQRLRRLEQMPPRQREIALRRLEAFDAIPPIRRPLVRNAIERLRTMPEAQRRDFLASDEAKRRFAPEELQLMRDVSGVPGSGEE